MVTFWGTRGLEPQHRNFRGHNSAHNSLYLSLMYHFYNKIVRYIILPSFFRNLGLDRWHVQEHTTLWMEPGLNITFVQFLPRIRQTTKRDVYLASNWADERQKVSLRSGPCGFSPLCFRRVLHLSRDISMLPTTSRSDFPLVKITFLENLHLFPFSK